MTTGKIASEAVTEGKLAKGVKESVNARSHPGVQYATTAVLAENTYNNGAGTLTANANGALKVDGAEPSAAQRVLVKNEAAASHNGIYQVTATGSAGAKWVLTRASDMNVGEQVAGSAVWVEKGTINSELAFYVTGSGPFTLGTTSISWGLAQVTEAQLRAGAVSEAKLAAEAVSEAKLKNEAVTASKIAKETITATQLAAGAVTSAKLAAEAVTEAKLGSEAVSAAKLKNEAVETAKLKNEAVTAAKLAAEAVTEGKLAAEAVNTAQLKNLGVTEGKLASEAVSTAKLKNEAVTEGKLSKALKESVNARTHPNAQYATAAALAANTYNNGAGTLTSEAQVVLSLDGASPKAGERILVKNEATPSHNGIYSVTSAGKAGTEAWVLTRASAT